jgi:hypothetical protein
MYKHPKLWIQKGSNEENMIKKPHLGQNLQNSMIPQKINLFSFNFWNGIAS